MSKTITPLPTSTHLPRMANTRDQDQVKEIEVLLISAQDLKNVKHLSKMRAYAVAYVERDFHTAKTCIDEEGGRNPKWNQILKVKFHEQLLEDNIMPALQIDIYAHGQVREKVVGSARVLLSDVLKSGDEQDMVEENPARCTTVCIWRASGKAHGFLNLWVPPTGRFAVTNTLVFTVGDEAVEEVVEVVAAVEEKVEEKPVLIGSRAHSAPNLAVLGKLVHRSASV